MRFLPHCLLLALLALVAGCDREEGTVIKFPVSAVGGERQLLERQLRRFEQEHPDIQVVLQITPDAANLRHQLFVQWLNARVGDPDILQLDVIWAAEFAAAGWIMPLDRFKPDTDDFFAATLAAGHWRGKLHAMPWFADVGMLYWRTDLMDSPPATLQDLVRQARAATRGGAVRDGLVWQGAAYEGLVCVFVEHLGAFGGRILDDRGRVVVDSDEAVAALTFMRDSLYETGIVPQDVLGWREEDTRFQFQNGNAAFLRNWPYAYKLMQDPKEARVAGQFAVAPIPPGSPQGQSTATLGGQQLAINAHTEHPEAAWKIIEYLTHPKQMRERAEFLGQFPPRRSLYEQGRLQGVLAIPPQQVRQLIASAVPRPVTPVYTELSDLLQIHLHRALTRQVQPRAALRSAAEEMRAMLRRVGLNQE